MKKKILKYSLIFLTLVSSFLTWNAIDRAINVPAASLWLGPIVFFSLTFIFLSLITISIKERSAVQLAALGTIFFSLIFTPSIFHLAVLILSYILFSVAVGKARDDLQFSIKVDFYKSVRAGSTFLMLALSLAIASHYFFETKNTRLENIIPKFDMSGMVNKIAPKIITYVNPEFKNIEDKNLTVDQWILETEKDKLAEVGKLNPAFAETGKDMVLKEGRAQLAEFTGFKISGQERMADIIMQMVSNKISNFVAPNYSNGGFPIFPLAVSGALFLTLFSLGSFLRPFWTWIAQFIFWLLRKIKLVKIVEELRDVEVIQ